MLQRCLRGQLRDDAWLDKLNRSRVVRRRLVKAVAATNLAHWITATFPNVPIAYIVRHPFAVADSVSNLYDEERADGRRSAWDHQVGEVVDGLVERSGLLEGPLSSRAQEIRSAWRAATHPFDRIVLRWCLENYLVLTAPPPQLRVVFFEDLFTEPAAHFPVLADHLGVTVPAVAYETLDQPSESASRRDRRPIDERISAWTQRIERERLAAALTTLEVFDLHRYYGEDTHPLRKAVTPDHLLGSSSYVSAQQ
jgi:hypothetical protein